MGIRGFLCCWAAAVAAPAGVVSIVSSWAADSGPIWNGAGAAPAAAGSLAEQKLDADGDGRLSREEYAAGARALFRCLDADRDLFVTPSEADAARLRTDVATHGGSTSEERIAELDRDRDDLLSAQEHAELARGLFARLDSDSDGFLTVDEIRRGRGSALKARATFGVPPQFEPAELRARDESIRQRS